MNDTISREAVADAINGIECTRHTTWYEFYQKVMTAVGKLPSAQPEIIRCKDCKNWDTTWTNDFSPNYHYCPMVDGVRKEDWFCADAERKIDE